MITKLFSDATLPIPCQHCGHKMPQTVRRLENDPKLTCPKCQGVTHIKAADFRKGMASVDKAVDDLKRSFAKLGKR